MSAVEGRTPSTTVSVLGGALIALPTGLHYSESVMIAYIFLFAFIIWALITEPWYDE